MKTIIEIAREAGWEYADGDDGYEPLWRFAALVRADERKRFRIDDREMLLKVRAEQIVSLQDEIRNLMGEE